MKKSLLLLLAVSLLAACSSDSPETETTQSSQETISSSEDVSSSESTSQDVIEEETAAYEYDINQSIFTVEPIEDASVEVALLTFDDAPQPPNSYSLDIAHTVKEKDANAIFFVVGQFLEDETSQAIIKEIYDMGFEIGNHSYSHPDFHSLTYEEQKEEIVKTNDNIEAITGQRPRFIRPPYGQYDDNTLAVIEEEKMTMMNWTYGYDWEEAYMNTPALADIMVNTEFLGNGANLLMHDREWTAGAIGDIIDGLREKGYEMVDPALIASPEREED
ncbi:MAG TPA: polysaccharide deacetylase family protein [Candidatus Jeotgalibaca merdavium]|uniref:Polysaccharide deacetylase family protein n=1 Tax=Candidatus Jeotgalibaca merdavium TaxID=2838627 RepID=A0A9D2KVM0_9LACT|nr:polysaccharide deacetylase family protein [Candidatus Jeotgalibaca merdavium]